MNRRLRNAFQNGIGPISGGCIRALYFYMIGLVVTQVIMSVSGGLLALNYYGTNELSDFHPSNIIYSDRKRGETTVVVVNSDGNNQTIIVDSNDDLTCSDTVDPEDFDPDYVRDKQLTVFLISLFLGAIGVDRFVTGHICCGLAKLFTLGGCGVWWLVDWILILTGAYCRDRFGYSFIDNL